MFGPLEYTRRDLAALNIMRARDNGIADYNTLLKYYQLVPISNWSDINKKRFDKEFQLFKQLESLYGDINNIDMYVGGLLESVNGEFGPLFKTVIKDQLLRIRDADRFWFENTNNGFFTEQEIEAIRKVRLYDILINVTTIKAHEIQNNVFFWKQGDPCIQPKQLVAADLEPCVPMEKYDYFAGNEAAYINICCFLGFVPIICMFCAYLTIKIYNRRRKLSQIKTQIELDYSQGQEKVYATEWLHENYKRAVKVRFGPDQALYVVSRKGDILRKIDLESINILVIELTEEDKIDPMVLLRIPKDHDLVLQFVTSGSRQKFLIKIDKFLKSFKKTMVNIQTQHSIIFQTAETKERRQKRLEQFFRDAYAQTFGMDNQKSNKSVASQDDMTITLSKGEFAEALGMKPNSIFVERMFGCVDKNHDEKISFQEFLDTVVLFSKGTMEDKLRIMFDMCDSNNSGRIIKKDFSDMLRSLVELAHTNLGDDQITGLIDSLFESAGLAQKSTLVYEDFYHLLEEHKQNLKAIGLDFKGMKQNFLNRHSSIVSNSNEDEAVEKPMSWFKSNLNETKIYLEVNRQHITCLVGYFAITVGLALERHFYYRYLTNRHDLWKVLGYGIGITRGAAASMSFTFSLLLLTMCRNILTKLRDTAIHQYIPLDAAVTFHKILAITGLVCAFIHSIGHLVNFYQVSTQPFAHLNCLFPELIDPEQRPVFTFWVLESVTGLTGVLLVVVMSIIYVFSLPKVRHGCYPSFAITHKLYLVFFLLIVLHGCPRLLDKPKFWFFFIGPALVFTIDKLIGLKQTSILLEVLNADLLPSDVTCINFVRPPQFTYRSGQWVRVACEAFTRDEYHSFTLTSAPHEGYLSIHVKAQGPWTWKLRNTFDPNNLGDSPNPKIRLEGPYGGGNQDWYKFEVAVMVGGGIGVTPYASILNDLVFGTSTNRYSGVRCKKVYFIWVCPTHRHFEWFIDVLRDVEDKDVTNVLEMHIFITQFFHKFDLRTTMLYICENHFQQVSQRSMFTGLKAINHFGRPNFPSILRSVQRNNMKYNLRKIGVFSCGPTALTNSVTKGCLTVNKNRHLPQMIHHFENF